MLFQVEKLDSGVVQRTKQAWWQDVWGISSPGRGRRMGPGSLELMTTMIILRDKDCLCLCNTLNQERSHSRLVLVKPHPKG